MRAMHLEADHLVQFGTLVHLIGSVSAHLLLQRFRLRRINPVLQIQPALQLIPKRRILLLLGGSERIKPILRGPAVVQEC